MLRHLALCIVIASSAARAGGIVGPRFCDPKVTTARALLDADVVLEVEVIEFNSKSTPTQVGQTYLWTAKVKVLSVVLGDYPPQDATFSESCSGGGGGGEGGGWIPPCLEPIPQSKGGRTTLFLKKAASGFTFLRTRIEERHASDCPPKSVVDEAKKKHAAAWAKVAPSR